MDYHNNVNYHNPQNAGYYQNNGNFNNQGGDNNNNLYPRSPQYENRGPQYINYPTANYNNNNNNYDGGGVYPDNRNGYNDHDIHYSNVKSTSPSGSAYGDSGYNTPYVPSPVNHPSSPVIPGMNPTYPPIPPISSIPTHQVSPYGGRPTDTYNEGASSKGMYSYSTSPNPGPTNHGQEKTLSPTSAYSNKPFLDYEDDEKRSKPGGLMKYCCCGGRMTCCKACAITCCVLFFLIVVIVVAILIFARPSPPSVNFLGIIPSPNGLPAYTNTSTSFDFNLGLRIQVDNPNIVGANFEMIKAIAFYPGHSDPIGGGNLTDVTISAKGNTTINFPFSIDYSKDIDPGFAILIDILQKCGITGGQPQKLQIDYKLTLTFKVLLFTINPSFNKTAMIDCPIKDGKIPNIPGFDISKATKAFGGTKKRDFLTEIPPNLFN